MESSEKRHRRQFFVGVFLLWLKKKISNKEIEALYESKVTQEKNEFLLPQVLDFVHKKKWINLYPEYQRRLVWSRIKKSRFIESILMNVPTPPIFLYEWNLSRYEIMDGQQRLNAIVEFYDNRLVLAGLELWDVLNGRKYADCPPQIQRGLDRKRISTTVLLAENITSRHKIRRILFERLNTGGQSLNAQEMRNCLFSGKFNELIKELAGERLFNEIWDIPPYEDHIRGTHISKKLSENPCFKRMTDCEIVLRFFAFRKKSRIRGSVRRILDLCMEEHTAIDDTRINELRNDFLTRLQLAHDIFAEDTFRITDGYQRSGLSQALYDAVMISLDRLYEHRDSLRRNAQSIREELRKKFMDKDFYDLITGKPNTANAIKKRLDAMEAFMRKYI
ncbi:DUF262 domain-containing protein [Desulfobacterales bacterium HSG2]|nr:DUF262 domain-containing protein [Desulfobacterales bacterium HSG2]